MHLDPCLLCLIKKPQALIDNWEAVDYFGDGIKVIRGTIAESYHEKWIVGEPIRTSPIKVLERETGHVTTENSLYRLGNEASLRTGRDSSKKSSKRTQRLKRN